MIKDNAEKLDKELAELLENKNKTEAQMKAEKEEL